MGDNQDVRNYPSSYNSINYGTSFPPQAMELYNSQGQSQVQYQQQQNLMPSQNQFNNQSPYYYYYQHQFYSSQQSSQQHQQSDACYDNDSNLSSNLAMQTTYSECQNDNCDMYYNSLAFLKNQEINLQNEQQQQSLYQQQQQSLIMLPTKNSEIFNDVENRETEYMNQNNNITGQSYMLQQPIAQSVQSSYLSENGNHQQNNNMPQNVYVPNNCFNQNIRNYPAVESQEHINDIPQINTFVNALNGEENVMKPIQQKRLPINNGIIDDIDTSSEDGDMNEQQYSESKSYCISFDNSKNSSQQQSESESNSKNECNVRSCNDLSKQQYETAYYDDNNNNNNNNNKQRVIERPRHNNNNFSSPLIKENTSTNLLISIKVIKKQKPKKKYNQSRQKNVFKNFGNALINCIYNNFTIREFIAKCMDNDSTIIEAFHNDFLKDSLHSLKNKEDFLKGWRIQENSDDSQCVKFKQIFKEASLRFFNDYAEKYVKESDKLKNKDIHIKAIPIFITALTNVNHLSKFKLS